MLRFQNKPDSIFAEILTRSLESAIDHLGLDLVEHYKGKHQNFAEDFFEEDIVNAFGGGVDGTRVIINELGRLLSAHRSEKLFMPTDYHFKLLDRVIRAWCDMYNSCLDVMDEQDIVHYKNKVIEFDADFIVESFFWDTDYDLPEEVACQLKRQDETDPDSTRYQCDIVDSAINASMHAAPDTMDLVLVEYDSQSGWLNDYDPVWDGEDEEDDGEIYD